MSKSGVTHTDTSSGKGGGQLTENPATPAPEGGIQPQAQTPAPSSGSMYDKRDHIENESGKSGSDGKGAGQQR
ncbi:hypothetical protein [Rubellimicrobium roseum]|uniref:Uncharacterized protein n=1 Tax=Rubellimicrobium roseum TaxID=687525 RepID=A0A5C4N9Y5_9RHOB|nr:hypothetical protein [Rubellimicrobium roseum]TNC63918.1 hypothetical protein FHG71_19050 [Rubellimicrobium roseum]